MTENSKGGPSADVTWKRGHSGLSDAGERAVLREGLAWESDHKGADSSSVAD